MHATYGALSSRKIGRRQCSHHTMHSYNDQTDGTSVETCVRCGARWVIWPSGSRVRVLWAR